MKMDNVVKAFAAGCGVLALVGAVVVFGVFSWAVSINNQMVVSSKSCDQAWAQVENVYQRRLDLIPNLVQVVKGAAQHELDVQVKTIEQRANATKVVVNAKDAGDLAKFASNQGELGSALARLMVSVEAYPQIKANENFLQLQSQLEGTENRISVERMRFTQIVQSYNSSVSIFPNSVVANLRGFAERPQFKADASAATTPKIEFEKQ
jgi:LemA protein